MKCEKLDVWKRSCRISVEVYRYFSNSKNFGFKDQITRSSLSIASNIAEGMEKKSQKEKLRFLEIAKGSAAELITQIYIGMEIEYIRKEEGSKWIKEIDEILKMLTGLQSHLKLNTTHLTLNTSFHYSLSRTEIYPVKCDPYCNMLTYGDTIAN